MADPNSEYSQAFSSAIANYRDSAADDVTNNNAFLSILKEKGNSDPADGGVELTEQVLYNEVASSGWYTGSELLDVQATDVLTSANYAWKQFYSNIVQDGLEDIQNAGQSRILNLIEAKIKAGMATCHNAIGTALFNSNTENSGKALGGLQHLVSDVPATPIVGGIDASVSSNAFWRNYLMDPSENGGLSPDATTILQILNIAFLNTDRGNDQVDTVLLGTTYFNFFESALQANQRFMDPAKAVAGFKMYEYKSAKMIHDPNCRATNGYGLNTDYFFFRPFKGRNFKIMDRKDSVNQDAYLFPILFAGNLTVSSRQRHFVIDD
jgi:hypothetical protein